MTEAAAFTAWLGAAMIVLADGRRALALGLALTAAAFAVLAWVGGDMRAAAALFAGGAVSAVLRLRSGSEGWGLMPPGSTPRLILAIVAGVVALWIAASVTTGAGAPLRFATLAVLGLMGARVLGGRDPAVVLTAVAGMALAVAMATGLAVTPPGPAPYILAALLAAGVSVLRIKDSSAA
ncbi:MAG TPA: hypothetical protein VGU71_17030 [Candidatus Dormibacteraeota bacterium]|nr:hypothetical protein [Candidatus Dormibacteraeota bacterium]